LAVNAAFGVAWFDSLAALFAVPLLLKEATQRSQGRLAWRDLWLLLIDLQSVSSFVFWERDLIPQRMPLLQNPEPIQLTGWQTRLSPNESLRAELPSRSQGTEEPPREGLEGKPSNA
jgi:hypothetical protein